MFLNQCKEKPLCTSFDAVLELTKHTIGTSNHISCSKCRASGNSSTFLSPQVSAIITLFLQVKKNWKNIFSVDCLQNYEYWPEETGQKMGPFPRATDWLTFRLA